MLECDVPQHKLSLPKKEQVNVSPDGLGFAVAAQLFGNRIPPAALVNDATQIIRPNPDTRTTLWHRHQLQEILRTYRPRNLRLVERMKPYQPEFEFPEAVVPQDCIFYDDITPEQWQALKSLPIDGYPSDTGPRKPTLFQRISRRI